MPATEMFNPLDHPAMFSPIRRLRPSGWVGHIPFGRLLIEIHRPTVFVELGSHVGVSYCAFCQTVEELELPTRCFAVDTWEGDQHTGPYDSSVLSELRAHHDPLYGSFSELIRARFDEALLRFADVSIDLLHIDGYHTYDAVKDDFETWLPKMSDRGIVLFHDTAVRRDDFGVWRLWEEVSARNEAFAFDHGNGLGVLAVGKDAATSLEFLFGAAPEEARRLRAFFAFVGDALAGQAIAGPAMLAQKELDRILSSKSYRSLEPLRSVWEHARGLTRRR